ncbi:fungal specific transcription factor [Hirsutella rhossiliensis]|uniref:pH-response transcription factor pacC/RIM101 n=1 Tax=Hirsutella rhossiliensis TaxID=111463 RepID=A0A9P8MW11_9HYPO|nr:fungal specific transcription factor domain-containing protein [Hirsutella rhossiliensis]KAH0963118.1 fungal specific transcription factor domain-containing protein [Hirsutella rhossiliensis]
MAGPSLSHILDPPRPPPPVPTSLDAASVFSHHTALSAALPIAGPGPGGPAAAQPTSVPATSFPAESVPVPAPTFAAPASSAQAPALPPAQQQKQSSPSSAAKGHGNNFYACRDCGRSYSRPEHLVRHVQTHTLGRRFICDICHKSFARKDLLRRHVANHENDSPQKRRRTASSPGAGRVTQACRPCAAARVKCDEAKPCRRCLGRKLVCVSSESGSAAAMHLVHLSANAHTSTADPNPVSSSGDFRGGSYSPASQGQVRSVLGGYVSSQDAATAKSTPLSHSTSYKPDDSNSRLPTPDTAVEQANIVHHNPQSLEPPNVIVDMDWDPFFDFLRDVLYEQPYDPSKFPDSQGLAPLDFCNNANLELTDMDFGLLDHWNLDGIVEGTLSVQEVASGSANSADISQMRQNLVQAWTESPWRWDPKNNDSGYKEQSFLPVPATDTCSAQLQMRGRGFERVVAETLEQPGRDRVLAIVLSTCRQNAMTNRVAASFPTVEVMDTLVHIFLAAQACQADEWIHFPTFKLNDQWPEWIAMAAAVGAALTSMPTLRKFGFAVQEAVRITIPTRFEENNTTIQRLGLVQSLILVQDLGLFSGNRRKMEIAECHLQIPVTMMRYRGTFQRSKYPMTVMDPSDEGEVLKKKWKSWVEREQWKRLVFHCYVREAQTSMTTLTNLCISYSELSLPLPEARELWLAENAVQWKERYLERNAEQSKRAPSVGDLLHDVHLLTQNHSRLDVQYSISIFLHGFWALILEYRQLSSVHRTRSYANGRGGGNAILLLNSRHQELVKDLQSFQLMTAEWSEMSAREHLLLNLLMLNLHVSLDDMQLFSGKEGEDQARRIYPVLQQWAASGESRSAAWCAAQVLRHAKLFPPDHLTDFYAVAVHHAALALWTYGVVARANRRQPAPATRFAAEPVFIDGSDPVATQRFVSLGQGRPLIRGPTPAAAVRGSGGVSAPAAEASLLDPRACMEIAQDVLRSNFSRCQELPPIVENLCHVMRQLGNAAWAVGLG